VYLHQEKLSVHAVGQGTVKKTTTFVREQDDSLSFIGLKAVDVTDQFGFDPGPAFSLSPEDAQVLMDSLWECGLRPVQGAGSAGQLDAVKYHLEDMRKIVNNKLGLK
jgi:hypothetical protein